MKYGLYCMRDVKGSFMAPAPDINDQTAVRNFAYAVNNNNSVMNFAPKDFQLYKVGTFDSDTGSVECITPMVFLTDGASMIGV